MGLWMVRPFPGQFDRMRDFLEQGIIAVHWGIGDLTGCITREEVATIVARNGLKPRDASLKTGLLFRFTNVMKTDDYCLVPYDDVFYIAQIKSDYYFDSNSVTFEHQREVEWLFDGEPFVRKELPTDIQTSLKSQLAVVELSKHGVLFQKYLMRKINGENLEGLEMKSVNDEMSSLEIKAMEIIRNEMVSDDPNRRLQAAIAIMEIYYKENPKNERSC